MVAPAVEGIDLFKVAGRSISGWIPSLKRGAAVRQPFCSQLEERLILWLEYHPQVKSYARGDIGPQFAAHRSLPEVGRIKRVSLVGKREQGLAGRGRTLGTKLLKELAERGLYLFTNEVAKGIAAELEIPEGYLPQLLFWEALHK
jgi:hypothetical protein